MASTHLVLTREMMRGGIGIRRAVVNVGMLLVGSSASWGDVEPVYGPWQHAATLCTRDPFEDTFVGTPLASGDVICSLFNIDGPAVEIAAFLGTGAAPSGTNGSISLSVQIRQAASPGMTVTSAPLILSPQEWSSPRAWYTALINVPLNGTYWVCVKREDSIAEISITQMTEFKDNLEHRLSWNANLERYEERSGLRCPGPVGNCLSADHNFPDPYIRVRQRIGLNNPPKVEGLVVEPDPAPPGAPVSITALASDADGLGTILASRLTYTADDNPTLRIAEETPFIENLGDQLQYSYVVDLAPGSYRFFFDVRDAAGRWSDSQVAQPVVLTVSDSDSDCPDPPPLSMGPPQDQCNSPLCEFVGLGTNAAVLDPDGEATSITNEYSVCMNAPWSVNPFGRVLFRVRGPSNYQDEHISNDHRPGDQFNNERWYQTFDMTALPSPAAGQADLLLDLLAIGCVSPECDEILNAKIESCDQIPPELKDLLPTDWFAWPCSEAQIRVYAPPPWYGEDWVGLQEVRWHEDNRIYQFLGMLPWNPNWFYPTTYVEQSIDFDQFGISLRNAAGAKIDVDERYEPTDDRLAVASKSADGGIEAWLLGLQVFDKPFEIEYDQQNNSYDVEYTSLELLEYEKTLVDKLASRYYLIPPTSPVLVIRFLLSVDLGLKVALAVCSGIDEELRFRPVCLQPGLTPYLEFDASADLYCGVAKLGLKGRPSITANLPFCYDYDENPRFYMAPASLSLDVEAQAYACLFFAGCKESDWFNLFHKSWTAGQASGCPESVEFAAEPEPVPERQVAGAQEPFAFPEPQIESDGLGHAMAVWIHDDGTTDATSDLYYSYYDGASWSAPSAVAATAKVETSPTLTFLSDDRALVVAVQNQASADPTTQAQGLAFLAQQELVYSVYDPATGVWEASPGQPYAKVHDDGGLSRADGAPKLHGPALEPWLVWVRDPDSIFPNDTGEVVDTHIWASRFGLAGVFEPALILRSAPEAFLEPDIAHDCAGNALAAWIRDADGDGRSGLDRRIEARYYDATAEQWGSVYTAVDSNSGSDLHLRGLLWPSVGFDAGGLPVIVFTARTSPNDNGTMPNGIDEYGEGTDDYLFVAARPGLAPSSIASFTAIRPLGGPYQHRGRWPRMDISDGCAEMPIAAVGSRWFEGRGFDGYDGEPAIFLKTLPAAPIVCSCDGDANGDNLVNVSDLLTVFGCIGQPPTGACVGSDINCDGSITSADANTMTCLLGGGAPPVCCPSGPTPDPTDWPNPIVVSDDAALDWQVDIDIDPAGPGEGTLRAVWVRPDGFDPDQNPRLPFGQGFDTVYLMEMPLGPDPCVEPEDVCASRSYPQPGELVTLRATIRNRGTDVTQPVTVGFYLDAVAAPNLIGSALIAALPALGAANASVQWTCDGQSHTLLVAVDNDNTITEPDEANNLAAIPLAASAPPLGLTATADPEEQRVVLTWDPPKRRDPAAPPLAVYRVYRAGQLVAVTPAPLFVDTEQCTGPYEVTAVTTAGAESLPTGPLTLPDSNGDGVGDACAGPACLGDFTGDGTVNAAHLALLLGSWGTCAGCPTDLNRDGVVNAADLALLLGNWGPCT